ncbi:fad-linked sulfhydryl oxidase erv2 [Lichtheimia corymbifera JMRC:FSU:9682]|uniref:Sulfhydryl oxidase n=1 Tax=Lichtheimia corymbifera JMRC:FSU:9682 TaxID=1263082 RepID=A0A068S6D6_9FUNG|nr:fad-linked sulfhydryl oxidase erv2 [Lichtheimia corymbifera JMRC:FSU:9682]
MRRTIIALFLTCLCLALTASYVIVYPRNQAILTMESSSSSSSQPATSSFQGHVISAKMNNATIKAELGRSTWKLLHTMAAQFPDNPSDEERDALTHYFTLLSRLYPCGECAAHFQLLLERYPPQTSSKVAVSQWLCAIHNKVNERLGKEMFDCADIQEKYQCGCEADEKEEEEDSTHSNT